jgi:hypothetical protein
VNTRFFWHVDVLSHGVDVQGDGEGFAHIVCDCGKYLGRVKVKQPTKTANERGWSGRRKRARPNRSGRA